MATDQQPTVRRRRLGSELRRLRLAAGKSLDDAAEVLECHKTRVSRIENAQLGVKARDVRDLLNAYGVDDAGLRARLEDLARAGNAPNWWASYADAIGSAYTDYVELEQSATHIRTFQTVHIPGLLQTEDYARAIVTASPVRGDTETIESRVRVRMDRQDKFWAQSSPTRHLTCVLWEPALRAGIGGSAVMTTQLRRLLTATEEPGISVHVLPTAAGAALAITGPFVLLEFAAPDPPVVYVDNLTSTLFMERWTEIQDYRMVFEELLGAAPSIDRSRDLISKAVAESSETRAT
jgi:transcriptional regulator with XRE-family HTH domain